MNFAEKLKSLRQAAELTQTELARRVGLATSTLSRFEASQTQRRLPSEATLNALASALGVEREALETHDVKARNAAQGRLACRAGHRGWNPAAVAETAVIAGLPRVGEGSTIGHFAVLDALHDTIEIGTDCVIGDGVHVLTQIVAKNGNVLTGPVKCGNNVTIGANAVLLPGTALEDGAVVLPGTTGSGSCG